MSLDLHLAFLGPEVGYLVSSRDLYVTYVAWLEMTNKRAVPMEALGWLKGHLRESPTLSAFRQVPARSDCQKKWSKEQHAPASATSPHRVSQSPANRTPSILNPPVVPVLTSPLTRDSHFIQGWQTDFIYSASSD